MYFHKNTIEVLQLQSSENSQEVGSSLQWLLQELIIIIVENSSSAELEARSVDMFEIGSTPYLK